jgi:hypothetical protein
MGAAQMESLCPRLGGFGTVERNTGRWPVRPAGILPAAASDGSQRSKTPLGAQTEKSVFLSSRVAEKENGTKEAQLRGTSDGTKPNLIR